MSDIGIFMFGGFVLGVTLAATMVLVMGTSQSDENEVLRIARQKESRQPKKNAS